MYLSQWVERAFKSSMTWLIRLVLEPLEVVVKGLWIVTGNLLENVDRCFCFRSRLVDCGKELRNPNDPDPDRKFFYGLLKGFEYNFVTVIMGQHPQDISNKQSGLVRLVFDSIYKTDDSLLSPFQVLELAEALETVDCPCMPTFPIGITDLIYNLLM